MAEVSEVHVRVNGWCHTCGGTGAADITHENKVDVTSLTYDTEEFRDEWRVFGIGPSGPWVRTCETRKEALEHVTLRRRIWPASDVHMDFRAVKVCATSWVPVAFAETIGEGRRPPPQWIIRPPEDVFWTPDEMAQIGRAVQSFQAGLPGVVEALDVSIEGLQVLPPGVGS